MNDDAPTVDWLSEFHEAERRQPGRSCSACGDCDREREAAAAEIARLRAALESLKGDPKVAVGRFEATRVTSQAALNARIDRILNPGDEEREE